MKTLIPAYCRDYTSARDAINDYLAGKDFIFYDITSPWDGKPSFCSCHDFPNETVTLRYNQLRQATFANKSDSEIKETFDIPVND